MSPLPRILAIVIALACAAEQRREVMIPGTDLAVRPGWLLLVRDGCRFSIPLDWKEGTPEEAIEGPHGATLIIQRLRFDDWAAHVTRLRNVFAGDAVIRDGSGDRLWIVRPRNGVTEEYAEAHVEDGACAAILRYPTSVAPNPDLVKQILDSLGSARTR
jgi:hypothetical protein